MSGRRKLRVLTVTMSLFFGVVAAEIGLRLFCPLTCKKLSSAGVIVEWEASRPFRSARGTRVWEQDFAASSTTDAVASWDSGRRPIVDHQGTQFFRHPVRGWECGSGVRGRDHFPARWRDTTRLKVLAVGDSFTFGSDVAPGEAWCSVVERLVAGAEVLNCGVPGYGVDQIALKLDEIGAALKPDVVLWGLINDDILRAGRPWFPRSAMPKPQLEIRGDEWVLTPPRTQAQVVEQAARWTPRVVLTLSAGVDTLTYYSWESDCVHLFRDLARISKRRVEAYGARLVMVLMPTGGPMLRTDDALGAELLECCSSLGLEVLDVRAELRKLNLTPSELDALTLRPDGRGHYTAKGNALVAKLVAQHLGASTNQLSGSAIKEH